MKYEFDSRVRYSELDQNGQLAINSLIDYFQDCSVFQSESIGDGYRKLRAKGQAWILSSWQIVIDRCPGLGEKITVGTWPYDFKYALGLRNFTLSDEEGKLLAWANSVWVLYDMVGSKPVTVDEDTRKLYGLNEKLDMDYSARKIRILSGAQEQPAFEVGLQNLDTNRHVNNAEYVKMALAYLPEELQIRQMRVEYRFQARLGDTIHPAVSRNGDVWQILLNREDGLPYAIIEVE